MLRPLDKSVADPTYLEYFGLARPPFARLEDTSQLFQTQQHALLMEHLASATRYNDSRVVICGADGSGKSTLLDHYITTLDDHIYFVAINETCRGAESFYSEFLSQIGFNDIGGTVAELQNITREFLVYRGNAGDPVLLIIDNAHQIDPIILEQLRWICEVKVEGRRVISVVLAGNADLVRIIDAPAMSQTRFDRHVVFSIRNFTEEETASYVWHRLNLAGGNDGVKFASHAHPLIHRYSGGIPQLIDALCDDMLTEAHGVKSRVITEKIVRTVADKQRLLPHVIPPHGKGRRKTDPDFKHVAEVPKARQTGKTAKPAKTAGSKPKESRKTSGSQASGAAPKDLAKLVSQLSEQVADLRADKLRALQDIAARNEDIGVLRNKLDSQAAEINALTASLATSAEELAQQKQVADESVAALNDREIAAKELAARVEKEKQARERAEKERAKSGAATDELKSLRDKLAARNKADAGLKSKLAKAEKENALAQRRIAELEHPNDLPEIKSISDKLATDFEAESRKRQEAEARLAEVSATDEELRRDRDDLKATVASLESELSAAAERVVDFESIEKSAAKLKQQVDEQTAELDSLREERALQKKDLGELEKQLQASHSACELAQRRILELKSPKELEEIEKASARNIAELEKEKHARAAAEKELEKTSAAIDELKAENAELQASLEDSGARLGAAEERAAEFDILEKKTAGLEGELEAMTGDLESLHGKLAKRDEAVAELESQLLESKKELTSARGRIKALTDPQDLQEVEQLSDQLAAELADEKRAREAAETQLQRATATTEELTQSTEELRSKIDDLEENLESASKRARDAEALETSTTELKAEIEQSAGELKSLRAEMAEREEALAELDTLRNELVSRDEVVAELEARLADSEQDYESAKSRIALLKDPEEVERFEKLSDGLSADLEKEKRARESAETELARFSAKVEELDELEKESQSTIDDLKDELESAQARVAEMEVLEKSNAVLKEMLEEKSDELDSLRNELALRESGTGDGEKSKATPQAKRRVAADKATGKRVSKKAEKSSTSGPNTYPSHVVEKFEQSISDVRAYQALRKYDSDFYDGLIAEYKELIAQNLTEKQVNDALRATQAGLVEKRLAKASDGAVIEYARVIVDQLDEFESDDTEPCFTLLIPPTDRKGVVPPAYSEKTRERELYVLEKTVRTYESDRPLPAEENVWPNLEPIFAELFDEFGEENVSALQNSDDSSIDRKLACRIVRTLYSAILGLPKRKSVKALRWILSE